MLITAAGTVGRPAYLGAIEEIDGELAKVIEDFDRAVNVEALHRTKETGEYLLSQCGDVHSQLSYVEQELLLKRLKQVETGYDRELCCMAGTREFLLDKLIAWATDGSVQKNGSSICWIYGSPGIGKTSLAHSISARLDDQKQLTGAFFCRRDDPDLKEPRNILPTLINKLAIIFPPFRSAVAKRLRNNPNLTPESMKESLLHDLICSLPRHPVNTLVLVIDALDECGDARSQPGVLKALTNAATQAPWMKIIITSRPEVGIQRFFDAPAHLSHPRFDLAADQGSSADLRAFAKQQFGIVASDWHITTPWPEKRSSTGLSLARTVFSYLSRLLSLSSRIVQTPQ